MISLIATLPTVQLSTVFLSQKLLPKSDVIIDDNDILIDQLSDRLEEFCLTNGNGRKHLCDTSGTKLDQLLWLGSKHSPLRTALEEYLKHEDITLILFSIEEQLWQWLTVNSSLRVASLVIQANNNIQNIISRSHAYKSVCSILVRCATNEIITLQRFVRPYIKVDGIFDDNTRLMIKLVIDLALLSEEIGDHRREEENNELEAQRNYDRALKLCALAKKL